MVKFECEFVTESGSVYTYSWMTETLYRLEGERRTHVIRGRVSPIEVGERVRVVGSMWRESTHEWVHGSSISTSPVRSRRDVPDRFYEANTQKAGV